MDIPPPLPINFPCWCRAVYSWGGETKKDLGFVEGDLIECLNAGDGSWWMGRLWRDRRAMGMFPSNFVKVLDQSFVPVTHSVSLTPEPRGSATPPKTKPARKPFQSYSTPPKASPNPSPAPSRQSSFLQQPPISTSRQSSLLQQHQNSPSRHNSQLSQNGLLQQPQVSPSRQNSYLSHNSSLQQSQRSPSRQNSHVSQSGYQRNNLYSPSQPNYGYVSRASSPAPPVHQHLSRGPSPAPQLEEDSPPPPPPPHRVAYTQPTTRAQSPMPPSPGPERHGHTPSPLRDAMEDVMSSLQDMTMRQNGSSPDPSEPKSPLDVWSPDSYNQLRESPRKLTKPRPQTSLGLGVGQEDSYADTGMYGYDRHSMYTEDVMVPVEPVDYKNKMSQRLRSMQDEPEYLHGYGPQQHSMAPPPRPGHGQYPARPVSSLEAHPAPQRMLSKLRNRKSAYELGKEGMSRTLTLRSNGTNVSSATNSTATHSSASTQATRPSVMSGQSAGQFSATSAGSLARRKGWGSIRKPRPQSVAGTRMEDIFRPQTPMTGISYHSSHASEQQEPAEWGGSVVDSGAQFGGLTKLKPRRSGFLRKLVDSAKAGAASTRSSIAGGGTEVSRNPVKGTLSSGIQGIASGGNGAARDMGLGSTGQAKGIDWVQVRRDVNRSNSLSKIERQERSDRSQMLGQPDVESVDIFDETVEGDEGADGRPVAQSTDFQQASLQLVDKSSRFITSLPHMTNPASLAQGYVCRPYRSDVQRLRAIFTWVSEKVSWEEDFEGNVDTRRAIHTRRGSAQEIAILVLEMCQSVGLHAEVVHGWLKPPDELPQLSTMPRPNHWWNFVICDGEWRMMDCSLASPANPKRALYSTSNPQAAESFYFLTRPTEACYTHIPMHDAQQHIVPQVDPAILLALPCALPPYFRNNLRLSKYSTSLLYLDGLELLHLHIACPSDTEIFAEVSARSFAHDVDGDRFESGETVTKRALAQPEWKNGAKVYSVKAVLPGDEGGGTLHVYAGKRGMMHSIRDNPHPRALTLPVFHAGENPAFDFLTRHPTPHAQRHDLYLAQPQCRRLACNNTFVFSVRQHPSSPGCGSPPLGGAAGRPVSPNPFARPASAMSMTSSQASGSNPSTTSYQDPKAALRGDQPQKPAKLAIQAPSGKILRLSKKVEGGFIDMGGTWETVIKVGERGTWRGLVLADRSARWCVWGEWECV